MPGGFASIVAVHAEQPLPVADKPLTVRKILRQLADSDGEGLLYQVDRAVPA